MKSSGGLSMSPLNTSQNQLFHSGTLGNLCSDRIKFCSHRGFTNYLFSEWVFRERRNTCHQQRESVPKMGIFPHLTCFCICHVQDWYCETSDGFITLPGCLMGHRSMIQCPELERKLCSTEIQNEVCRKKKKKKNQGRG